MKVKNASKSRTKSRKPKMQSKKRGRPRKTNSKSSSSSGSNTSSSSSVSFMRNKQNLEGKNILLLGIIYTRRDIPEIYDMSGQLERDGQRCMALEQMSHGIVFTADTNREPTDPYVMPGRHCRAHAETWNASVSRNFRAKIEQAFGAIQFSMIGLDYYHFPAAYARLILTPQFFQQSLPGYATTNFLLPRGVVWLPHFDFVEQSLAQPEIQRLYNVTVTDNPTEYPLYEASESIIDSLQQLPDGFSHVANCQKFFRLERKT